MPTKSSLPQWIPPQLAQLVEKAPSGAQWLHEIKIDGFRMAAREVALECAAAALNAFRFAARAVPRALGRAEVRRRDNLFNLDRRQPVAADGLCRAARGQACRTGAARAQGVNYLGREARAFTMSSRVGRLGFCFSRRPVRLPVPTHGFPLSSAAALLSAPTRC
jgi:hypothetical protein